ncbi:hypothetical protein [Filimonas effusa]|uniref:Uncharacterized protein n=1 Tax=Filimonas effusa TaxID=2508721 RepID=A0A4Q1D3A3_9BACT|nr:hypothetical protein [Filimonas effusa]RXK82859.1 hypothetical protein ESB13_12040 [Filimonas effusa]
MKPLRMLLVGLLTAVITTGCYKDNQPAQPVIDFPIFQDLTLLQANSYLAHQGITSTVSSKRDTLSLAFYDETLFPADSLYFRTKRLKPLLQDMVNSIVKVTDPRLPDSFFMGLEIFYPDSSVWDMKSMLFYFTVVHGAVN